jgi:hypothetical protein
MRGATGTDTMCMLRSRLISPQDPYPPPSDPFQLAILFHSAFAPLRFRAEGFQNPQRRGGSISFEQMVTNLKFQYDSATWLFPGFFTK